MNWTGGSLKRTKKANQGIVQKQKAFFARSRAQRQYMPDMQIIPARFRCILDDSNFELKTLSPASGFRSSRYSTDIAKSRDSNIRRQQLSLTRINVSASNSPSTRGANQYRMAHPHHYGTQISECESNDMIRRPISHHTSGMVETQEHLHNFTENCINVKDDTEIDSVKQMLELKRKRLLRQHSWIGIEQPAQFIPSVRARREEKDSIGCRKAHGRLGAIAQQRSDALLRTKSSQYEDRAVCKSQMVETSKNESTSIQIQIGIGASMRTSSVQQDRDIQSQASLSPMPLNRKHHEAERQKVRISTQTARDEIRLMDHASQSTVPVFHEHLLVQRHSPCPYESVGRCNFEPPEGDLKQGSTLHDQRDGPQVHRETLQGSERRAPEFQITEHLQDFEFPSRLASRDLNTSRTAHSCTSLHNNIGEARYARDAASAPASRIGNLHRVDNDNRQRGMDEVSAAFEIVDGEPWKWCLAESDRGLSHYTTAIEAQNSLLHSHPTKPNNEAAANWSQHATHSDQTHVHSSCMSSSLPSIRRTCEETGPTRQAHFNRISRGVAVGSAPVSLDEDENHWRSFIFGKADSSSSKRYEIHGMGGKHYIFIDNERVSSAYSLLSAALSPVSSTPFRSISGRASCISDNVQDAAASAPPSGSRAITSPAFCEYVGGDRARPWHG